MDIDVLISRLPVKPTLLVLAGFIFFPATALSVDGIGLFELDRNAVSEPSSPGDDWEDIYNGSHSAFTSTGIISDPKPKTIFTSGGSKDVNDITQWQWRSGSTPPKDDITHAYAAAYAHPSTGDLIIYVGADRFANNGDATMGLWLFQEKVEPDSSNNGFIGKHNDGDLLFVANFVQGGDVAELTAYRWRSDGQGSDGTLDQLASFSDPVCAGIDVLGCALTNAEPTPSPWLYSPSKGEENVFPLTSFFEGGFNITQLFNSVGVEAPCFSSFLIASRSSTSVTAQLKDFVASSFDVCGIEITKSCDTGDVNADETAFVYGFSGTVENTGFGTLYNVTVVDDAGTPTDESDDITISLGTILAGQTADYSGSFESLLNPPTNTASVSASPSPAGDMNVTAVSEEAECPQVSRSPALSVDKSCHTDLQVLDGKVVVGIKYNVTVCNTGDIGLENVSVVNDMGTPSELDDVTIASGLTLGVRRCYDSYELGYLPSDSLSDPASASFTDTITATGDPKLGLGHTQVETGSATCKLCPTCPTCLPAE